MQNNYSELTKADISYFLSFLNNEQVLSSQEQKEKYASDTTENLIFPPSLILLPKSTEEISKIVKYCNEKLIPITPRGAGTGVVGGALPIFGGIVLSLEKMNQILKIDTENFQAIVEPGVINHQLQESLESYGLFYPPDPSSWGSCFIGGNVATNAGGPKAVKYGVTSDYIMNLEVVLPNGEIIWTGANTLKNSTGLNLTQLFVGSEGTLGIITKIVVKVLPKPTEDISLLIPFYFVEDCAKAVSVLLQNRVLPCALELMERNALQQATTFLTENSIVIEEDIQAHLILMFDGNSQEELMVQVENTVKVLEQFDIGEILFADNSSDKNRIWQLRRKVAEIVKNNGYTIEEDTVVPPIQLPKLINFAHQLSKKYDFKVVCYGHAGDGNLHVRINHPKHKNSYKNTEIQQILNELFEYIHSLGGTISGEHGIGLIQKGFLPIVFSKANRMLQKTIKDAIDPHQIMNPGKLFYEEDKQ
jgi:glycolate oxidase